MNIISFLFWLIFGLWFLGVGIPSAELILGVLALIIAISHIYPILPNYPSRQ